MWNLRPPSISPVFFCFLFTAVAAADCTRKWPTLTGNAPLVIARGGFSGLFPDSSSDAYQLAVRTGLPDIHVWCDVLLTKDAQGICFPNIRLQNASDISTVYPHRGNNAYLVNGVALRGWFPMDFTLKELSSVKLVQGIYSRTPNFDGASNILSVDGVVSLTKPARLWLNIPYDAFFSQHNLSMRSFIISMSKRAKIHYISSPEVGFLKSIVSGSWRGPTKLVFQFLGPDVVEPWTGQTYSSLVKNLTFIKTFAEGILVPKSYIWPVDNNLYLKKHTSLVLDAHKAGLEVYASGFVNDAILPYDFSYDPLAEYLSFIDNGHFSVDGVLSDFPLTPSAAIECFSHVCKNDTVQANFLILSSEGASGSYPSCTDIAYTKAVSDGVDILDCPVQMSSDGIPFCLGSINLIDRTNAMETNFSTLQAIIPDLNISNGILAHDLTWNQIQTLKPSISHPYSNYLLFRNPRYKNSGKLMQLSDFLSFANDATSLSGVLISVENAAYLSEKLGLDVVDVVLDALDKAGYNSPTAKRVMIKSSESAVLKRLKSHNRKYELVYLINKDVSDILNSTVLEIKKISNSVVLSKKSIFPTAMSFITGETGSVPKLKAFGLPVYVHLFQNEFVSQAWDFLSDPYVEINTFLSRVGVDGIVTDHPATASRFKRNRCLGYKRLPPYMNMTTLVQPGGLLARMPKSMLPDIRPPNPVLTKSDMVEPLPLAPGTISWSRHQSKYNHEPQQW